MRASVRQALATIESRVICGSPRTLTARLVLSVSPCCRQSVLLSVPSSLSSPPAANNRENALRKQTDRQVTVLQRWIGLAEIRRPAATVSLCSL